jgi:predicted RNA-binding protein (virulence factor B family)
MLELGKRQVLTVAKVVDFGVYLSEGTGAKEEVLLPKKEVPEGTKTGDRLEIFLYRDSKDRLIATREDPLIHLGEVAVLKVAQTGKIGAFLNWGLPKDLLLPFREQTTKVNPGDECLVALYLDKSSRLCATMKVYHYLKKESSYQRGDYVNGRIYEISGNFGAFVAVDDCCSGLIPKREMPENLKVGEVLKLRVTSVKADGKLDLSIRERIPEQMEKDAEAVFEKIEALGGALPFTDKADPEQIKAELGLTKNAFKRAVGRLLKQGKVEISQGRILKK